MATYSKAFISHSSKDKPLVERIAKQVSAARWEIDSYSFEEGKLTAAQILEALSRSDLLVLIASANSVDSPWVQSELEIAQHLVYSKKLGGVVVFLVDDTPAAKLPAWIRMYVFARTENDTRIANVIRSRLVQLDSLKGLKEKPFVQRPTIRADIERKLADLSNQANGLYAIGVDGIGRRTLVANTLASLFPGRDPIGIDISVADGEGILETYRKLYFAWRRPTVLEAKKLFEESSTISVEELVKKSLEIISEIANNKMFVWLQFDYAILDDDANIEPAFRDLLAALDTRPPTVIFRAKRTPRFQEQRKLKNIAFCKINSLTLEESRLLWVYALEHYKFSGADAPFIQLLIEHVNGHPAMIWMAAEYVASMGKAAIEANPRELLDALRALSLSLLDGFALTTIEKCLLALFDELGIIDPSDLLVICDQPDQEIAAAVSKLLSLGLLESEGDHLQLASFFHNARFRRQFSPDTDDFLHQSRQRLLTITASYTAEDNISFATVEAAVTTAIAQGKQAPIAFGERAVVGSHLWASPDFPDTTLSFSKPFRTDPG